MGCVPKKLFHNSGLMKGYIHMASDYGWDVELKNEAVNWERLRSNVQNHIKSLNFGYVAKMRELGVDYINAKASMTSDNKVAFEFDNKTYVLKSKNIIIASGGRPRYMKNKEGSKIKVEEE